MQPSLSTSNGRRVAATSTHATQLIVRVDAQVQKQAEMAAHARGTTLARMLTEFVQSVAESEQLYSLPRLEWLDNPRGALWMHLEQKHR